MKMSIKRTKKLFFISPIAFLLIITLTTDNCNCDQVVLLDTTKEATLEWTSYPYGPQAQRPGWIEESFTNYGKGINWRSYVVCDVAYPDVNNWLWSPFIDRGPANRLYIEIHFTIRDCSLFPGNALSCKETFSLLFYEFDAQTREPPPWQPESYKLIGRIAAGEGRFNHNSDVDINVETKSIAVAKKGVYFAFRDQGACISVLAVKVYYITCPAVTANFAHFNETPTGKEVTSIEKQQGTCVDNAEPIETPYNHCTGSGKWSLMLGGCKCKVGYEPDEEKQLCKVCPAGTFRSNEVAICTLCPMNSKTNKAGSSFCTCINGHYRHPLDGNHMPCHKPPAKPTNLTVLFFDQTSAILSWDPPQKSIDDHLIDQQFRNDVSFRVKCQSCSNNVVFNPSSDVFNETKLTMTNLEPGTQYVVQIHSLNGPSYSLMGGYNHSFSSGTDGTESPMKRGNSYGMDVKSEYAEITFTTESTILSTVFNVKVTTITSKEVELSWDNPLHSDSPIEFYEVRWFPKSEVDSINKTTQSTKDTKILITDLTENTEYGFQIRCKTSNGWGTYSNIVYAQTLQSITPVFNESSMQNRLVAGATVLIVFIVVLAIVATVLVLRTKNQDDLDKKTSNHLPLPLDYANNEEGGYKYYSARRNNFAVTTPLFGGNRSYVDPHTYEDPNQAIREFAREIDAGYITIEAIIGGGEFGDVCRGRLKIPPNFVQEIDVAIKTLKPGSSEKARCDFLTEASIMGQFDHPNVIYLQGVVTRSNPVMIITEYMENGSLDTFLRANDGKFQTLQLVGMLRGIAAGMSYLSDMNYVHRDLAARNVLVNASLVCKIADFGLSREIENASDAYTTRGGKIPVRWTAPEAIQFRKFTSASDVWSYGVVLWEVMSYGERPYWNWSNQDVIKSIEKGYRLPAPMDCPELLYQLMLDCWQKQRTHRPTFASITQTLDNFARQPQLLLTIRNSPTSDQQGPDFHQTPTSSSSSHGQQQPQLIMGHTMDSRCGTMGTTNVVFNTTDQWLSDIKMGRYAQHFKEAGLVTAQQVARLTAQQLSDMGITLVGHQKKILHQARQLDIVI